MYDNKKLLAMNAMILAMGANPDNVFEFRDYSRRSETIRRIEKEIKSNRKEYPWSKINIPAKLRKGKTYDELQEMRKAIYQKKFSTE